MVTDETLPRWVRGLLAVATVVLGAVIAVRPTTSLGALALLIGAGLIVHGLVDLLGHLTGGAPEAPGWRRVRLVLAVGWVAAGVVVLAHPALTVRSVAWVVGIGLIVHGAVSLGSALRPGVTVDGRVATAMFGVAGIVLGVLALTWIDITLLAVCVVLGARVIMTGLALGWSALRGHARRHEPRAPGRAHRWRRTIGAVVCLALAAGAAGLSAVIRDGSPVVDDFYAAPRDTPDEPGQLIRAERFTRAIPDGAEAWRILYTTTRGDGSSTVASGLVVVPTGGTGPWPVVDWAHGTTGFAEQCAPSLSPQPFESGALFVLPQVVQQGWALVATDYTGLGTEGPHPYLVGKDSAYATLDAVRAARQLDEANLGQQTVVWGHSQGGGAALWTGALAEKYAPDVPLDGVAALAPAANLTGLVKNVATVKGGSVLASFVMAAYAAIYDDVSWDDYVKPGAEETLRAFSERCLSKPGILVSGVELLALTEDPDVYSADPTSGALGKRLTDNIPPATVTAPLLLGQGAADSLIVPSAQADYVKQVCAEGQQVDYRTYAGRDHVPLVEADSPLIPDLIAWTQARLAGEPVAPGCTTSAH